MSLQHKSLGERWNQLSFVEQMANIGSEVERALNWRAKSNPAYSQKAFERALELFDFTLDGSKDSARLKEVARAREAAVDYFNGENEYKSTEASWRKYFLAFNYAARKNS